jgi:hypothetical protein
MNAFNRILLTILGLGLLAAGVLGLASTRGWVRDSSIDDVIPFSSAWDRWRDIDWSTGALWVLLGTAVLIALLALYLVVRELRPSETGGDEDLVLQRTERGRTVLRAKAVRKTLERQAGLVEGVEKAQVENLAFAGAAPRIGYRLRTAGERSLPDTGQEVIERASRSLSTALERPETDVTATMEVRHDRRAAHAKGRVE